MHQISEIQKHSKAVKEAEKVQQARQQELTQLKEEKKARPLGKDLWNAVSQQDPLRAPSLPVALTEELEGKSGGGGSLRTVTPKGSLVTDRLESMAARNMITKKKLEGRRIVQGKRRKKVVGEKGTEYLLI
jgi:nucleolar protein 53